MSTVTPPEESAALAAVDYQRIDIDWNQLDMRRFVIFNALFFTGARSLVYPAGLVKTRLQVQSGTTIYKNTREALVHIFRQEGTRGLYKGFTVAALGNIPIQISSMTTYELIKSKVGDFVNHLQLPSWKRDIVSNVISGGISSMVSLIFVVPTDVISQKLMIQSSEMQHQGNSLSRNYSSGRAVCRTIMAHEGMVGFYRGFVFSVLTYAPSSAVWWATYGWTKRKLVETLHFGSDNGKPHTVHLGELSVSSHQQDVMVQAIAGSIAGLAGVIVTHPVDVLKTRLQTATTEEEAKLGLRQTYQRLITQEGYRGLSKGLTARVLQSTPVSVLLIVVYELVKKLSLKDHN